jgi:hypothetical protein
MTPSVPEWSFFRRDCICIRKPYIGNNHDFALRDTLRSGGNCRMRIPVKSATHSGIKSAAYRSVATLLT